MKLPETLLDEYTFVSVNNPTNTRRGGVGLFYKNSLPLIIRNDLSFDESIVVEVKFGRKKILFTVLYRSPATDHNSLNFPAFLTDFGNLYAKIKAENHFATFLQETLMPILSIRVPPSPPLDRKIWHFNRANSAAIKSSMTNFPWLQHLNLNTDSNWQVKTFTNI